MFIGFTCLSLKSDYTDFCVKKTPRGVFLQLLFVSSRLLFFLFYVCVSDIGNKVAPLDLFSGKKDDDTPSEPAQDGGNFKVESMSRGDKEAVLCI